jgi:SAM-dependent methyltransferase
MLREKNKYARMQNQEKIYLPNIVFVVGDCSKNIKNAESSRFVKDFESEKILNVVMKNNKNYDKYYKHIVSKGLYGFDAVSCMFAIHYFFENEEKLDGFLNNVSQNLKKGGLFFCTFMDGT